MLFFLFKLGFSFVRKRTGKRTVRTKFPRYICWLPQEMMVLGMSDRKNCPQTHSAASYYAPCSTTAMGCPHLLPPSTISTPSPSAGYLCAQVSLLATAGENKLPLPSVRGGTPLHDTWENWSSPALELTPLLQTGRELICVRRENQ